MPRAKLVRKNPPLTRRRRRIHEGKHRYWPHFRFFGTDCSPICSVTIDPGLDGTGYAIFQGILARSEKATPPVESGLLWKPPKTLPWQIRANSYVDGLVGILSEYRHTQLIVMEMPELWAKSSRSMASAARGDLFRLAYLVGSMAQACRTICSTVPKLLPTSGQGAWKGQLTKAATRRRVARALGVVIPNEHELDAIAMGLSLQRQL